MIDYIEISKCFHKDIPKFGNCEFVGQVFDWDMYQIEGCDKLKVKYDEEMKILKVAGSLPYYLKGHNFTYSDNEFIYTIEHLQNIFQISLWDAEVLTLEHGVIMPVYQKPSLYIKNHVPSKGSGLKENLKGKDKGNFKWWSGKDISLKMYDAGKNIIKKQTLKSRQVIEQEGYNPKTNYLKFEAHLYNVPKMNGNHGISVEELILPKTKEKLDRILLNQYKLLEPLKEVNDPMEKSECSALNIVIMEYAKKCISEGKSVDDAKKALYDKINELECLSKSDKDARKMTLRKSFGQINFEESSKWDISKLIEDALNH